MTMKSKAFATLYCIRRITKEGLKKAVFDGVIVALEYKEITGEDYK